MNLDGKPFYMRHHDDDWYDEVRVHTVPRYKTSGLSGDEWRVSVLIQFLRKGQVLKEKKVSDIRTAVAIMPSMLFYYAPADDDEDRKFAGENDYCFQPGCGNRAVSEYRLKKRYCNEGGTHEFPGDYRVKFCQKHLRRGDCGLNDSDANYEVISGPGPDQAEGRVGRRSRVETGRHRAG